MTRNDRKLRGACRLPVLALLLAALPLSATAQRYLYSTQTQESSISTYRVQDDGTPRYLRHEGSYKYPATLAVHPNGRFLYTCSKSTDEIMVYAIGANGVLTARPDLLYKTRGRSLFGLEFHPSGRFLYAAARFSGVVALGVDGATGAVKELEGSPYPAQERTRSIAVHPSGRFLYAVNAYSNSITVYHVDQASGRLISKSDFTVTTGQDKIVPLGLKLQDMPAVGGGVPYTIAIHPGGNYLFVSNWAGASISAFAIDPNDGRLRLLGGKPFPSEINPYIVAVNPSGDFVYVGGWYEHKIAGYRFDAGTGTLKPLPGSPFDLQARAPVSIRFGDAGEMYVVNNWGNSISLARVGSDGVPVLASVVQTRSGPHDMKVVDVPGEFKTPPSSVLIRGQDGRLLLWRTGAGELQAVGDIAISGPWTLLADGRLVWAEGRTLHMMKSTPGGKGLSLQSLHDYTTIQPSQSLFVDEQAGFLYQADDAGIVYSWRIGADRLENPRHDPLQVGKGAYAMALDVLSRYLFVTHDEARVLESFRYRLVDDPIIMDLRQYGGRLELDYSPRQVVAGPFGNFVLVGDGRRGGINIYRHDPQSGVVDAAGARFVATATAPDSMAFSADGYRFYSLHNRKGELRTWQFSPVTGTLTPLQTLARQGHKQRQLLVTPSGKQLLVLCEDELAVHTLDARGQVTLTSRLKLPFTGVDMQLFNPGP